MFRLVFSSRRLLNHVDIDSFRQIQADATNKLFWQGFPVLVFGTEQVTLKKDSTRSVLQYVLMSGKRTSTSSFVQFSNGSQVFLLSIVCLTQLQLFTTQHGQT
jgi:hypothetical protein